MSTRRRPILSAAAAGILTTALAGCSSIPFLSSDGGGDGSEGSPEPGPVVILDDTAANEVVAKAPAGWDAHGNEQIPPDQWRKTDPEQCMDLIGNGQERRNLVKHLKGTGYERLTTGTEESFREVTVRVTSYDKDIGERFLSDAERALGGCETFSLYAQGVDDRYEASPLEVPRVAEQTFGVRISTYAPDSPTDVVHLDRLVSRSANNVVVVSVTTYKEDKDTNLLRDLAQETVDNIHAREG